jgi:hypothetical protein
MANLYNVEYHVEYHDIRRNGVASTGMDRKGGQFPEQMRNGTSHPEGHRILKGIMPLAAWTRKALHSG